MSYKSITRMLHDFETESPWTMLFHYYLCTILQMFHIKLTTTVEKGVFNFNVGRMQLIEVKKVHNIFEKLTHGNRRCQTQLVVVDISIFNLHPDNFLIMVSDETNRTHTSLSLLTVPVCLQHW